MRGRITTLLLVTLALSVATSCGESSMRVNPTPPSTAPATGPEKARRVIALQGDLGVDMHYSAPALASSLADGKVGESCAHATDDEFHRQEIAVAARHGHETLDHWTRVEAGYVAGACPAQLGPFLASLGRLGHAAVAAKVGAELARLGVAAAS